jgi:hypothetical protein
LKSSSRNIHYPFLKWQWIFPLLCRFFVLSSISVPLPYEEHNTCFIRNRNCLLFANTWSHPHWSKIEVIATKMLWSSSRTCWSLRNIHFSNDNESFPFYVDLFSFLCQLTRLLQDITIESTLYVSYRSQKRLTLCYHLVWIHTFWCCSSAQLSVVCFVPSVASVFGLSICDCPFGISNVYVHYAWEYRTIPSYRSGSLQ